MVLVVVVFGPARMCLWGISRRLVSLGRAVVRETAAAETHVDGATRTIVLIQGRKSEARGDERSEGVRRDRRVRFVYIDDVVVVAYEVVIEMCSTRAASSTVYTNPSFSAPGQQMQP